MNAPSKVKNTRTLSFSAILFSLTSLLVPLTLWVYQIAQFGSWNFDLTRMPADRIVSTCAKAFMFSLIIAGPIANLDKVREFSLRLRHAAAKD